MSTLNFLKSILQERFKTKPEKEESDESYNKFKNIQKASLLQEAKCFNDPKINEMKCSDIIGKIIYLINQGETFNENESTILFLSLTKLFQSNSNQLRRLLYKLIKELKNQSSSYIITSSLSKDINSKIPLFKINALRLIPIIIDPTNFIQVERYLYNSILDKSASISAAALFACIQLLPHHLDHIKKWSSQLQTQSSPLHPCLILLHEIKRSDQLSFRKLALQLIQQKHKNTLTTIQLMRFVIEILQTQSDTLDASTAQNFTDFIWRQKDKQDEAIVFEACKAATEIKNLTNRELMPIVQILLLHLNSTSTVNKFASLKILNKLISNPIRSTLFNNLTEIESLVNDNNRSLSSLAISILLKVCKDTNIQKLINNIYDQIPDIADEFKIDIICAVKILIKKAPQQYEASCIFSQANEFSQIIATFLFNCITKLDTNAEFKRYCIESFELMSAEIPESRPLVLQNYIEIIEDCTFKEIILYILNLINKEVYQSKYSPSKYVRYIYNRVLLEEAEVRVAALGTLGKFALQFPELKYDIICLLNSCCFDEEDEVRDQAMFYLSLLQEEEEKEGFQKFEQELVIDSCFEEVNWDYINSIESYINTNHGAICSSSDPKLISKSKIIQFQQEHEPEQKESQPQVQAETEQFHQDPATILDSLKGFQEYQELFSQNPTFESYGPLLYMCPSKALTDDQSEYIVKSQKFIFENYIVIEFKIKNTLTNMILKNLNIAVNFNSDQIEIHNMIPAPQLLPNQSSNVVVGFRKHEEARIVQAHSTCFLNFIACELNPQTGKEINSYDDEFQLEDLDLTIADFIQQIPDPHNFDFEIVWEKLPEQLEARETYQLTQYKTIELGIKGLMKHFGMTVMGDTDQIKPNSSYHTLKLAGIYLNTQIHVLVQCMIGIDENYGCVTKIMTRSKDSLVNKNFTESLE